MKIISPYLSDTTLYIKKDILKIIKYSVRENTTIETSCKELDGISSDAVFYHLGKLTIEETQDFLDKSIRRQVKKARIMKAVIVAIDFHDIPYYGDKNHRSVVGGKSKESTNYFFRYATIEIVNGKKICLHALPVCPFSNKAKIVKKLVDRAKRYVDIKLVLLDRGFFSSYVIRELQRQKLDFLMPAVLNKKILWVKESVYGYEMNGVKFNLIVGGYKWATSLTRVSSKLSKMYDKRWNIETGYREKKKFRITTTCKNHAIRALLFFISVILYNLWILSNIIRGFVEKVEILERITVRIFKMRFLDVR